MRTERVLKRACPIVLSLTFAALCAAALAPPARAQNAPPLFQPELTDPQNPQSFERARGPRFGPAPDPVRRSQPATSRPATEPPPPPSEIAFDSTGSTRKRKDPRYKPGDPYPPPSPRRPAPAVLNGPPQPAAAPQIALRGSYANVYRPSDALPRPPRPYKPPSEPFDPIGLRIGSFTVKPSVEITRGFDSNPTRQPIGTGSPFTVVAPELAIKSEWARHELAATLRGSYTAYDEASGSNRPSVDGKVAARFDASRDDRVDVEGRFLLGTDYPGSPNLPAGLAKLPIYTSFGGTLGYAHRFNRLEVSLKGSFDRTTYQDSELTDGSTFSNADRDYNQYGGQLRASYELTPGIKPFVEFAADRRVHDLAVDRNGERRDSRGTTPKVGTTFELTRILTGEVAIGYLTRRYDDPNLEDLRGIVADATLTWVATGLTTATLTARSSADESILPGVSGALRRDVGLQIDHALRRWLVATLKFGYGFDQYVGLGRDDTRTSLGAALTYKVSRELWLKGEARHERLRSSAPDADYDANIFTLGVKLQR